MKWNDRAMTSIDKIEQRVNNQTIILLELVKKLVITFVLFLPISSASSPLKVEHISMADGLPNPSIICQLQDRKGFMWFGTKKGLVRYDGYDFTLYQQDSDNSDSISHSYINALYEDKLGYLWIGTDGGGLNRFDPVTEKFKLYQHQPNSADSISNNTVFVIEPSYDGKLWIGTANGLNLLDPKAGTFDVFRHQHNVQSTISANSIRSILSKPDGSLWLGFNNGVLDWFDPNAGIIKHFSVPLSEGNRISLTALQSISSRLNTLLIGTANNGLFSFDVAENKWQHYEHDSDDINSLSDNGINTIYEDTADRIWIGTSQGLNLYNPISQRFSVFRSQQADLTGLSDDFIQSITEDKSGMLWFGTWFSGLNILDPRTITFNTFKNDPVVTTSLTSNIVNAIHITPKGDLWVGTNKGLNLKKKAQNGFVKFNNVLNEGVNLSDNVIKSILVDSSSTLWVGTKNRGIYQWDEKIQGLIHYASENKGSKNISHNSVQDILQRKNGEIWVSTRKGLNRWDPVNASFKSFMHEPNNLDSLGDNYLYQLYEDSQQRLWIASHYSGLMLWHDQSESFSSFTHQVNNKPSLSNNFVTSIYEDKQNNLWVGTAGGGLNKVTINEINGQLSLSFKHISIEQGLRSDIVTSILGDKSGSIWISTATGISRYDPINEAVTNFGGVEGAQTGGYLIGSAAQDEQGVIYFGGINGLTYFSPQHVVTGSVAPQMVFTELRLSNKLVKVEQDQKNSVLRQAIQYTDEITLNHQQSVFSIKFAALDFTDSLANQYRYQLVGFDQNWINTDAKRREVTYTNLSSGEYSFQVKASNSRGMWNENKHNIKITILPPPWRTWWAYTIYCYILITIVFYFIRSQKQQVITEKRMNRLLEEKVCIRTNELELLGNIGKELNASLDMETIFERLYHHLSGVVDTHVFIIGLLNEKQTVLNFDYGMEESKRLPAYTHNLDDIEQLSTWSVNHKKEVIIHSRADIDIYLKRIATPILGKTMESVIYMPLITGKLGIIGCVSIQSPKPNVYSAEQISFIRTLASYTAIALGNASGYNLLSTAHSELAQTHKQLSKSHVDLVNTQAQLVHSEKMAGLGTLTAGVAHEINNPVNFTHASLHNLREKHAQYLQYLKELAGGEKAEQAIIDSFEQEFQELNEIIDTAEQGTTRIKAIVNNLRVFTRKDESKKASIHIIDSVESTINLIKTEHHLIKFNTSLDPEVKLNCFPAKLSQVFMNVLINACHAIQQRQIVEPEIEGVIKIESKTQGNWICINIIDNGCGMDKATQKKIYDPFFTTKEVGVGTGLGMAITFGIIKDHDGRIEVDSVKGEGTELSIYLPF